MKTIFTLLLATVFTTAFAADPGRITITIASNKNVEVYVDGRLVQDRDQTYVLNNVQPGAHRIQVYRAGRNANGKTRNVRTNDRRNELIYSSTLQVRPSVHVDVMINRFGKALVDEKVLSGNRNQDDWSDDEYDDYGDYGNYPQEYRKAMTAVEFENLMERVRNQWFGKFATAKDAAGSKIFNTSQLRQLMLVFTADKERLELARFAHKNVTDLQNFKQVYDLLSYSAQTELDRNIRDVRYE